ncbi:hypothetical protein Tco_0078786 [Tanacetum coccineum]
MQAEEQEELSIEEKSNLFVQLLEARKKHFAAMRAQEMRNKPPTKAQKRNTMSTYLKNMAGYKHNQLKNKSFDHIQKLFDKAMKRVNTFVDMDTELLSIDQRPMEDLDLVLYGDLKTMFDPHVEDQVWKNQSDYRVLEWKLYDSWWCGVTTASTKLLLLVYVSTARVKLVLLEKIEENILITTAEKIKTARRFSTIRERIKTAQRKDKD